MNFASEDFARLITLVWSARMHRKVKKFGLKEQIPYAAVYFSEITLPTYWIRDDPYHQQLQRGEIPDINEGSQADVAAPWFVLSGF